jgi:transcriptional activator for dhaKLM operon
MLPTSYPVQHDVLRQIWDVFMETRQIPPVDGYMPDLAVVRSWHRCVLRANSLKKPRPKQLDDLALALVQNAQSDLLRVGLPYTEDIYQFIGGSNSVIVLTDGSGCVLTMIGDDQIARLSHGSGVGPGTYCSEGGLGTNAIGMALVEAVPIQVVGAEHYYKPLHGLCTTAAPIHSMTGRIIGTIGVIGPAQYATPHTLALMMAVARAIGNQLQADLYLEELNLRLKELNTILHAVPVGVISWDSENRVTHVNRVAGDLLQLKPAFVTGKPIHDVIVFSDVVKEAIAQQRAFSEPETTLAANSYSIRISANLHPILDGNARSTGYIAMLRPIEQVHRLVQQVVGIQTPFKFEDIVSQSSAMQAVIRTARTAARGMAPILLRGESGAGKNHLARAIHNESARADKPLVVVNCQAIPRELMFNEILGGSEDSAKNRPSKFELAHGGTLLFDNVESLPLEIQMILLQVIETGHVIRLGSSYSYKVDVRIISTTASDLEQAIIQRDFLADLYHRFGAFVIHVPPLRKRIEDIPLLAQQFVEYMAKQRDNTTPVDIEDEVLSMLCKYPWPGNVRELESALEHAVNQVNDGVLRVANFPDNIRMGRVLDSTSPTPHHVLSVAEAEREAILQAGWAFGGRVTEMAHELGISRTTLWRRMKQLNITPDYFKE